jgi:hypothetical protein
MFIQFNGIILNREALLLELRAAGLEVLSIRSSRWIQTDFVTLEEADAGGRIDVELELAPRHVATPRVAALTAFMAASPHVVPG